MNIVAIMGRLTKDPDVRQGAKKVARYTLAVDRGQQQADFIPCVAFEGGADFAEKYLRKGMRIAVSGRIQTGSYEKDGQKFYTTDVIVSRQEFADSKQSGQTEFAAIPDDFNPFA